MLFPKQIKWMQKTNRQKKWQKEVFSEVWDTRPHICEICWSYIPEPLTFVFAHIKSKWVHPELKFNPDNIALVCSIKCHTALDIRNSYKNDSQYTTSPISSSSIE